MLNKMKDILYCGSDFEKIKQAKPVINSERLKIYTNYQWERTKIYYLKEIEKSNLPWTDDEILKKYRFTNTRRELDKESKWLINNILDRKDISYENKLLNVILFRLINKHIVFENNIYPIFKDVYVNFFMKENEFYNLLEKLNNFVLNESGLLNNAYMLSGTTHNINNILKQENLFNIKWNTINKRIVVINHLKNYILKNAELSPPNAIKTIKKLTGMTGTFLAYQIWIDWTYIGAYTPHTNDYYPYSENEFVESGLGCHRGIMWMVDNKKNLDGLTEEEFIFWFRDNLPELAKRYKLKWNPEEMFHFLPKEQRNWGVMQIENSFCEFDKYCRTVFDNKKPKQKYKLLFKQRNLKI